MNPFPAELVAPIAPPPTCLVCHRLDCADSAHATATAALRLLDEHFGLEDITVERVD